MKYSLKEVRKNVWAVIIPNIYDLSWVFCRAQEFYESPNSQFRNKPFKIFDFMRWYSLNQTGEKAFTYNCDWGGFNITSESLFKCLSYIPDKNVYDDIMFEIVGKIRSPKFCLIGITSLKDDAFDHELCHAFYYLDENYRKSMDEITKKLPKAVRTDLIKKLKGLGYDRSVLNDEIQAYMSVDVPKFLSISGTKKQIKLLTKPYKAIFRKKFGNESN